MISLPATKSQLLYFSDVDAKIEIYNNIFFVPNDGYNKKTDNSAKSSGSSSFQAETSNFKSYIEESEVSNFKSFIEDSEAGERTAMLKMSNKQISNMEQATPPMNQVKCSY